MLKSIPFLSHGPRDRSHRPAFWAEALLVTAGAALVAASFNTLLRPNALAPGGLPGLSLLVQRTVRVEPAITQAGLNVVILLVAWQQLGRAFALRNVLGCLLLPLFVWLSRDWPALTHDRLLAVLCGAGGTGVGLGLVFRGRGSVGGFSALALILNRRHGISVDRSLVALDGLIVLAAAFVFPAEAVLCALVGVVLIGRIARSVLTGFDTAMVAFVVSQEPGRIKEAVLHDLDLGLTLIPARGGYTDTSRDMLMVVMRPGDVPRLKACVRNLDPAAFVVLAGSSEVLGYGFKPHL
ncbi:MAG: YitT family protein [Opitutaceae bacterium]